MKTAREKIFELTEPLCVKPIDLVKMASLINEIEKIFHQERTKDCYPKEFVEWIGVHCSYNGENSWTYYPHRAGRDNSYFTTTDELFIYWREQIK